MAGAICVLLVAGAPASGVARTAWVARFTFKSGLDAAGVAAAVSPDGKRVYVLGSGDDSRTVRRDHISDYATVAYNAATGAKIWVARYKTNGSNNPHGIAVSRAGARVYVTGDNGKGVAATVAYKAANGAQLWVARSAMFEMYGAGSSDVIGVSPDGTTVYISGYGENVHSGAPSAGSGPVVVLAYKAKNGTDAWVARYPASKEYYDNATPQALTLSPDGRTVYVLVNWVGHAFPGAFLTLAYDAATGALRWSAQYKGAVRSTPTGIAVNPDGSGVYVTGDTLFLHPTGPDEYATVDYDAATGTQRWQARYHDPHNQPRGATAEEIAVSPDGTRVYVSGESANSSGNGFDYVTAAYSTKTGAELWLTRSIQQARNNDGAVSALATSPDGTKVFVVATTSSKRSSGLTLAYDSATGRQLWLNRYAAPENRDASLDAIAISPDGSKVYVTGEVGVSGSRPGANSNVCATIAYRVG